MTLVVNIFSMQVFPSVLNDYDQEVYLAPIDPDPYGFFPFPSRT